MVALTDLVQEVKDRLRQKDVEGQVSKMDLGDEEKNGG